MYFHLIESRNNNKSWNLYSFGITWCVRYKQIYRHIADFASLASNRTFFFWCSHNQKGNIFHPFSKHSTLPMSFIMSHTHLYTREYSCAECAALSTRALWERCECVCAILILCRPFSYYIPNSEHRALSTVRVHGVYWCYKFRFMVGEFLCRLWLRLKIWIFLELNKTWKDFIFRSKCTKIEL